MSFRKIAKAKARPYKERNQLSERWKLGSLEKKKDYKERSSDYNKKRDHLKLLHKKALEKNPDEFYFHMVNSKTQDGHHFEKEKQVDEEDSETQKLLLENQDLRYLTYKLNLEQKKVEKLQASLQLLGSGSSKPPNKHTIFVDDEDEAESLDIAERLDTHSSVVHRAFNRPRMAQLLKGDIHTPAKSELKEINKERKRQYKELLKRMERLEELKIATSKLKVKRDLGESRKKDPLFEPVKEQPGTSTQAPVYKWPLKRKR